MRSSPLRQAVVAPLHPSTNQIHVGKLVQGFQSQNKICTRVHCSCTYDRAEDPESFAPPPCPPIAQHEPAPDPYYECSCYCNPRTAQRGQNNTGHEHKRCMEGYPSFRSLFYDLFFFRYGFFLVGFIPFFHRNSPPAFPDHRIEIHTGLCGPSGAR